MVRDIPLFDKVREGTIYRMDDSENRIPDWKAIRQSGNLYAYCAGNPIKYRDVNGYWLMLDGSMEDHNFILGLLSQLTNDQLSVMDGMVVISSLAKKPVKKAGTQLLRNIIGNTLYGTTIVFQKDDINLFSSSNGANPENPAGDYGACTNASIILRSRSATENSPLYILLGHELIHADHYMSGTVYIDAIGDYILYSDNGTWKWDHKSLEEIKTVGLGRWGRPGNYITENMLRKENGLVHRYDYGPQIP